MYGGRLFTQEMIRKARERNRLNSKSRRRGRAVTGAPGVHWIELLPGGRFDRTKMKRVGTHRGVYVWTEDSEDPSERPRKDEQVFERYDPYGPRPRPRPADRARA